MSAQAAENNEGRTVMPTDGRKKRKFIVVGKSRIPKAAQVRMEEAKERQLRALELRKARVTYGDIAKALGYADAGSARKAVIAAMRRQEFELAAEVVRLDLSTLDEMQMRCTEAMRKGDLFQVDRILRVMERRYSLLGVGSRTVEELQEQYGLSPSANTQINNSGVMIVSAQSSSAEFVKALMVSMGVDTENPTVQEKLKELEAGTEPKRVVKRNKKEQEPTYETTMDEEEIIDAEIVEDDVDE